jgi:hypothetical protein
MPRIKMSMRIGPMVHVEIEGQSCAEIADALEGFEKLNKTVDSMFSDLAERVYPEDEAGSDDAAAYGAGEEN